MMGKIKKYGALVLVAAAGVFVAQELAPLYRKGRAKLVKQTAGGAE